MSDKTETTTPTVHIIAQPAWHAPAFIVGDRAGLQAMLNAIADAILNGKGTAELYANDGEGYAVSVHCREDLAGTPYGYTDEMARSGMPWPKWLRE